MSRGLWWRNRHRNFPSGKEKGNGNMFVQTTRYLFSFNMTDTRRELGEWKEEFEVVRAKLSSFLVIEVDRQLVRKWTEYLDQYNFKKNPFKSRTTLLDQSVHPPRRIQTLDLFVDILLQLASGVFAEHQGRVSLNNSKIFVVVKDIQELVRVKTEVNSVGAMSRLYIANANKHDSGNYTCSLADVASATIAVHVLNAPCRGGDSKLYGANPLYYRPAEEMRLSRVKVAQLQTYAYGGKDSKTLPVISISVVPTWTVSVQTRCGVNSSVRIRLRCSMVAAVVGPTAVLANGLYSNWDCVGFFT
uniref:Uncharacterized protein n=1 Tax=Timema douglasi TaxID=61478 RepID=A0A7R8VBD7_TIMDO|nr:unnamed protein product [Timema douglasi]